MILGIGLAVIIVGGIIYAIIEGKQNKGLEPVIQFLSEKGIVYEKTIDEKSLETIYTLTDSGHKKIEDLYKLNTSGQKYNLNNLISDLNKMEIKNNKFYKKILHDICNYNDSNDFRNFFETIKIELIETYDEKENYYTFSFSEKGKKDFIDILVKDLKENKDSSSEDIISKFYKQLKGNMYLYPLEDTLKEIKEIARITVFKDNNSKFINDGIEYETYILSSVEDYFACIDTRKWEMVHLIKIEDIDEIIIDTKIKPAPTYKMKLLQEPSKPNTFFVNNATGNTYNERAIRNDYKASLAKYEAELLHVKQHNDEERRRYNESLNKTIEYDVILVSTKKEDFEFPIETKRIFKKILRDKVDF